jgi:hypothetical protein
MANTTLSPVVHHTMLVHKQAHAFQINKTALSSQALNLQVMMDALGQWLNLSASIEGMIKEWLQFFEDSWSNFCCLQLLSFHNKNGNPVNNTSTAANPAVMLPLINDTREHYSKAIKFAHVQLSLEFTNLVNVTPKAPTILCMEYHILLPQTAHELNDMRSVA